MQIASANGFASTIDPIVAAQLARISSTYGSGTLTSTELFRSTLTWNEPVKTVEHFPTTRIDYQMTPAINVNGAFNIYDRDIEGTRQFPGDDITPQSVFTNNWMIGSTSMNWTVSPTVLLEARYGIQRNFDTYNVGEQIEQFNISGRLMRLNYPLSLTPPVLNQLQINRNNALQQFYSNLTLLRGAHTVTVGGTYRWVRWVDKDFAGGGVPQFSFGVATGDPVSSALSAADIPLISQNDLGNARNLYAFLTGRLSAISAQRGVNPESLQYQDNSQLIRIDKQRTGGIYVQDQWRVNPRLTLNYGLRWQATGPVYNATGIYTSPTEADLMGPSTARFRPGELGGPSNPVIERRPRTYESDWLNFAPNVGVAWSPQLEDGFLGKVAGGNKLVIRGGYSRSFFDEGLNTFINYSGANPGLTQRLFLNPGQPGFQPGSLRLSDTIPSLLASPAAYSPPFPQSAYTFSGTSFSTTAATLPTPSVHSWNIGVQREIASNTVFEARYVGNRSSRWRGYDLNEINVVENGFLQEFRNAQQNLAINRAAGVESFQNRGLPGQMPLPIFEAAFGPGNGEAALTGAQGFANGNFITQLTQDQAGGLANSLAGSSLYLCRMVGSALAPCNYSTPGRYPINFFQANPFAAGSSISIMTDGSWANYHALQLELRRRYTRGLTISAAYTLSKARGDLFADSDQARRNFTTLRDPSVDEGPSAFDIRHIVQGYWTWELPFGRDRRWASGNGIIDRIIGGWSISGINRWQSGKVFRLVSGRSTFNQRSAGVVLADITRDELQSLITIGPGPNNAAVLFLDPKLIGADGRANPQYLQSPAAGELGEFIYLYGPRTFLTDLAVLKDIAVRGDVRLSIWVEALNVFNTNNFTVGGPGADIDINSTTFGQTSNVGGPRNAQLRVKISF